MRQGERVLPREGGWSDSDPPFRWGPLPGWQSNIAERTGAGSDAPLAEQLRPYQGYEFRIPFARLGRPPWQMRVEIRDFLGESEDVAWPAGSSRVDSGGWAVVTPATVAAPDL